MSGARHLRQTRARRHETLCRRASRTLIIPLVVICLAAIAGGLLAVRKTGPDLFDLTPRRSELDGYSLIAWYDLERGHHALKVGGLSSGTAARVLGYMMDGAQPLRDGQLVDCFVLLPDAGSAVHPAHRFGEQMIEVRLRGGDAIHFSGASLVWVWGTWRTVPGDPAGPLPLYGLVNAHIQRADKSDISKYFR